MRTMGRRTKKALTLLLAVAIVGLYTFGDVAAIFAAGTDSSLSVSKTANWVESKAAKDQGIAKVQLTVNSKSQVIVHKKTTKIVLVLDRSGSMAEKIAGTNTAKISSLKSAAGNFVDKVLGLKNADVQIAVVSFAGSVTTDSNYTNSASTLKTAINNIRAGGGTNTQAGIQRAESLMSGVSADNKFIVVLSDGEPTYSYKGTAAVSAANETGYNYNGTKWPYRITSFSTDRIGSGGSYDLGDASYNLIGNGYTALKYNKNIDATKYYYKIGNEYYNIGIDRGYYYYYGHGTSDRLDLNVGDTIYSYSNEITNNGYGTVSEAYNAKAAGNTLFSIGFDISDSSDAISVMKSVASSDSNYFAAGSNLQSVFDQIQGSIENVAVGNGAVVTDPMGSSTVAGKEFKFKAITNDANYPITVTATDNKKHSATYNSTNDTFTWNLTDGNLDGTYTLTYYVKLNIDELKGDLNTAEGRDLSQVLTNNGAQLTYIDGNNNKQTLDFTDPSLPITHYTVHYHYSDNGKDYTEDTAKTTIAAAITGCSNIEASNQMISHGNKAGYMYEASKTKYGTNDARNGDSLAIVDNSNDNIIDLYYVYKPASGSIALSATKSLTGGDKTLQAGQFNFNAVETDADGKALENAKTYTATNDKDGKILFDSISYGSVGTHYYKITEVNGGKTIDGIKYDNMSILVKVEVKDSRTEGKLVATATYPTDTEFNNTYSASGSINLKGTKVLNGRALSADDKFDFAVYENGNKVAAGTNDSNGSINFSAINYTAAGNHTYTVKETSANGNGVSVDTSTYTVTVKVTDDGKGNLKATPAYPDNGNSVVFTNNYSASPLTTNLQVKKVLTGKTLSANAFSFTAVKCNELGTPVYGAKSISATNDANGKVKFADMTFNAAGTYYYLITENNGGQTVNGMHYDGSSMIAKIVVQDNNKGQLVEAMPIMYTVNGQIDNTFNNVYKPDNSDPISLTFTKVLNSNTGKALAKDAFSFVMTDNDGNTYNAKNAADGKITFSNITYSKPGTYTYDVKETAGSDTHITYDNHTAKATVVVTDVNGKLVAGEPTYTDGTFTNTYTATESDSGTLTFHKELKSNTGRKLAADEFSFVMKDNKGTTYNAKNDKDGDITFSGIKYSAAGTYTYEVKETTGSEAHMTYDTHTAKATVVVTDVNGKLVAGAPTYTDETFTNTYTASDSDSGTLTFNKVLKSNTDRKLAADEFSFVMKDNNGTTYNAKNDKDGKITFSGIKYSSAGTYTYEVKETAGSEAHMTYDTHTAKATVVVTDVNGKLVAGAPTYTDAIFTNEYKSDDSSEISLNFNKVLNSNTGRVLAADEYSFVMKDNNGTVYNAKNDIAGNIKFSGIKYSKAGTYTYEVKETAGTDSQITYDTHTAKATVVVTDVNGKLVAGEPTYTAKTFTNKYTATDSEPISLTFTKVLSSNTDKVLAADEFSFVMKDNKGTTYNAKNDKDGKITFSGIKYSKAGTYTYEVKETAGTDSHMKYDTHTAKATVVVTDKDGKLVAGAPTYTEAQFSNEYKATDSEPISLTFTKVLSSNTDKVLAADEFSFVMKDNKGTTYNAKNDKDGKITFSGIKYSKAGTYTYDVTETAGTDANMTYDTHTAKATVVVTDKDGKLVAGAPTYTEAQFSNEYKATDSEPISLTFTKVLNSNTGKELTDGAFNFVMKDNNGTTYNTTNDKDGNITFSDIKYSKTGTYTYEVKETAGTDSHMKYDTHTAKATVVVTDRDGKLVAGEPKYTDVTFTNEYTASPVEVALKAHKTLAGRDLAAGEFTFHATSFKEAVMATSVTGDSGNVDLTAKNAANGDVTFDSMTFSKAGTYKFVISEENGGQVIDRVTYDSSRYIATVVVTDDGQGQLTAKVSYNKMGNQVMDGQTMETAEFSNVYVAPPTVGITATKVWDDNGNAANLRPTSITVHLMNGATVVDTQVLSADNNWTYTWKGIPKNSGDQAIKYTVVEETVANYQTTIAGGMNLDGNAGTFVITNTVQNLTPPPADNGGNGGNGGTTVTPTNNNTNGGTTVTPSNNNAGPKTGDTSDLALQLIILGLATSGLGAAAFMRRRGQSEE